MVNDQDFELAKDKFVADTGKISQVANGDENTVVETDNGPVRSMAKMQKDFLGQVADVEKKTDKNGSDGYVGLSGFKLVLSNTAGAVKSFLTSLAVAPRNWAMPDKDGTVALVSDIPVAGVEHGYAPLDSGKLIPASFLPSYVDDVIDVANVAALPVVGETGKIYITDDTNAQYRWSGSSYIKLVASPGSSDAVPEGVTNLYFTEARAKATKLGTGGAVTGLPLDTDGLADAIRKLTTLASKPVAYDVGGGFQGKPAANALAIYFVAPRAFTIPSGNTLGIAIAAVAATSAASFDILYNGTVVGTIVFAAAGTAGVVNFPAQVNVIRGDRLTVRAPAAADASLADVSWTFGGQLV